MTVRGAYWALPLDWPAPRRPLPAGYAVAPAGRAYAEQLAEAMGLPVAVVEERFRRGDRVWVAWRWAIGDEIASWLWVSVRGHFDEVIQRPLVLAPDEAHGWGGGTRDGHRCKGLFSAVLGHVAAELHREGRSVLWNGVHDASLASRCAHSRAGFRPVLRLSTAGGRLRTWPADYADPQLLERARRMLDLESPAPVGGKERAGHVCHHRAGPMTPGGST